jgi:hypothetical protein
MFEIKDLEWDDHTFSTNFGFDYQIFINTNADFKETYRLMIYGYNEIENLYGNTVEELQQKANEHWRSVLLPFLREV